MPFAIETHQWGLKKEVVRLTAEAAPNVWHAVQPDSFMDYELKLIEDKTLRGLKTPYQPYPGIKTLTGKMKFPVRAKNVGEYFVSLLGAPTTAQQGGSTAYKSTWNGYPTIQPPTYTIFVNRGVDVQKYSGCGVKAVSLVGSVDGAVMMEADLLGLTEASGSIGSPVYADSEMLEFFQTTVSIAGSPDTNIHNWAVKFDNGLMPKRQMAQSQDAADVVSPGKLHVTGSFKVFFENETQRNNFLANTTVTMEFKVVGSQIGVTGFYNTFDLNLYNVHYKNFKFGAEQGILSADVSFEAFYDNVTALKQYQIDLTNTITAY